MIMWNTVGMLFILVHEATTLRYFNMKKPVTIQVDATGNGFGTTPESSTMQTMVGNYSYVSLMQNGSRQIFLVDTSQLKAITCH